jgi:hypothetical protein
MLAQFGMFFGGHRDNNSGPGIIGSIALMIRNRHQHPTSRAPVF